MADDMTVGQVALKVTLDDSSLPQQVSQSAKTAQSGFSGLEKAAGKLMGALGAAFAVDKILDFGSACINVASDLQEVQNVVDTAFGDMASQVDQWAKNAITGYGMSELSAKETASTYMSMATAMGAAKDEAAEMSLALAGLSGDVASFFNLDQDTAAYKLRSVFTGETEALKDLGVVMTQTNLGAWAMANGYNQAYSSMNAAQQMAVRYGFVMDSLSLAQGDFAKTSQNWANQVRILQEQWSQLQAIIGNGLISALTPALQGLNNVLSSLVSGAQLLSQAFASVFGSEGGVQATTATVSGLSDAAAGYSAIGSAASDAADSVSGAGSAAAAAKRQLMGFDKITKLADTSSGSSGGGSSGGSGGGGGGSASVTTTSSPVVGILDKVTESTGALEGLEAVFQKLKNWIDGLDFGPLKTALAAVKEQADKLGQKAWEGLEWLWDNVLAPLGEWTIEEAAPAALNALAAALGVVDAWAEILRPVWQWLWDHLLAPTAEALGNEVVEAFNTIEEHCKGLEALLRGDFSEAWEHWGTSTLNVLDLVVSGSQMSSENLSKAWEKLDFYLNAAADGAELIGAILSELWEMFTNLFGAITEWCAELPSLREIVETLMDGGDLSDLFPEDGLQVKLSGVIEDSFKDMQDAVDDFKDKRATARLKGAEDASFKTAKKAMNNLDGKTVTATAKGHQSSTWTSLYKLWKGFISKEVTATAQGEQKPSLKNALENYKKLSNKDVKVTTDVAAGKITTSNLNKWMNNNILSPLQKKLRTNSYFAGIRIPFFAKGGFVRANTPQLAIIGDNRHEGEYVAPESKLAAMAQSAARQAAGGGSGRAEALLQSILNELHNTPRYSIDEESLRKYFIRKTNANTRSTGRCELTL